MTPTPVISPTYVVWIDSNGVDAAQSLVQQMQQTDDILLHLFELLAALGLLAAIGLAVWLAIRVLP